jgi:ankyrin repeat protein
VLSAPTITYMMNDGEQKQRRTPPRRALPKDDIEQLLEQMKAGANLEAVAQSHGTALHAAAAAGKALLIPHLITPTTLNQQDKKGFTPLQVALLNSQLEASSVLVAAGASLYGSDDTPGLLSLACLSDHVPALPLLLVNAMLSDQSNPGLAAKAVNRKDSQGTTALHWAAEFGSRELVAKLLAAGADRDAVDKDGATPLWLAVDGGHAHLVPLLVTPSNANLAKRGQGTPFSLAAAAGQAEAVAALLAAGVKWNVSKDMSQSVLAAAAEKGHWQVVQLLLEALVTESKQQKVPCKGPGHKQGQQGTPNQAQLVEVVAAAVAQLSKGLKHVVRCSQLLEVVLDVLGSDMAREVCLAVQKQLQQEQAAAAAAAKAAMPSHMSTNPPGAN